MKVLIGKRLVDVFDSGMANYFKLINKLWEEKAKELETDVT